MFSPGIAPIIATLMTLNLHAYHPMNEERRVTVSLNGKSEVAASDLFFFSPDEIARGLSARQAALTRDISLLSPDLIFLQEVAGGSSLISVKTCADFNAANTALDLKNRLGSKYQVSLACRGNSGWWTDPHTFSDFSVFTENSKVKIAGPGSNPYPNGMIVEGLAILTSNRVQVLDHRSEWISTSNSQVKFFIEWMKFGFQGDPSRRFWIAVNIHGLRDIQHFEGAVATRKFISAYLSSLSDQQNFSGLIVGGDFNAYTPELEANTTPWSYSENETDVNLKKRILDFNRGLHHPLPANDVESRADTAIAAFNVWKASKNHLSGDQSLKEIFRMGKCSFHFPELNPECSWKEKIDHVFLSNSIQVKAASGFYSQNNWTDLAGTLTDHPGVWTELQF